MANSISVRSAQFVQYNIDTQPGGGNASVSLVANREFFVADWTSVNLQGAQVLTVLVEATNIANPPVTATIAETNAQVAATILRPTVTGAPGAGLANLDANAAVVRGGTLKISIAAALQTGQGYLTILPGNRYSATVAPVYYANNATTGAQGSNAVQSI
jgi:hypothetical protein